ncbi:hypothetical protein [Streptomyces camelliae]|uniref:Secreted protein n=1 Tax=Streptomyces camelliae TaxID=3004093 RepID=A0ABY7NY86_9ACTN|nr:hypothetical protein [Streptomyces sp. HUAS 2-6]WBO63216.1 hypothetical protein O1G22_10440 [Streptomyces sp. HUAS 2-6]
MTATRVRVPLAAAGALALLGCAVAPATALADPPQPPHEITGQLIPGGADGTRHEVLCPPQQHAYGGGYALSARTGTRLSEDSPADVWENRPNDNASGWIVTVRKTTWLQQPQQPQKPKPKPQHEQHEQHRPDGGSEERHDAGPADLTLHVTCSDEAQMHGM